MNRKTRLLLLAVIFVPVVFEVPLAWKLWHSHRETTAGSAVVSPSTTNRRREARQSPGPESEAEKLLLEANEHFRYEGRAIHPAVIQRLDIDLAANSPANLMVDVAVATKAAEHSFTSSPDGLHEMNLAEQGRISIREPFYGYRYVGRMNGQIHVLETVDCGGGTGVFCNLMFLRFSAATVQTWRGSVIQLRAEVRGVYPLGDRWIGDFHLQSHTVRASGASHQASHEDLEFAPWPPPAR